jgi:ankyrin repeat protein
VAAAAVLIDAGASLRVSSREGDSLCMVAISQNFPAMLGLLLQKGVSPHVPDRDGLLPLYWAEYLQREELVGLLLAAGADPQLKRVAVPASGQYTWREF